MKTAIFIGKHRVLPPLSIQPNGYGWLLSWFGVYKDPAAALHRIGRFQQWLDFSVVLALCWLAKRILIKTKPILIVSAWTLILLQPFTGLWSRTIYSEQFVSFSASQDFSPSAFFCLDVSTKSLHCSAWHWLEAALASLPFCGRTC
jgi:hypothetical protein